MDYNVIEGCVGIIDGIHVVLYRRPDRPHGTDFFNRKGSYSFNIFGISDHQRAYLISPSTMSAVQVTTRSGRILSTACTLNNRSRLVSTCSPTSLSRLPIMSFLCSSDYLVITNCTVLRRLSIVVWRQVGWKFEHTYGMLKCRFSSFQGLRVTVNTPDDEGKVGGWIRVCAVLNNLLLNTDYEPERTTSMDEAELEGAPLGRQLSVRHHLRRRAIMHSMDRDNPVVQSGLYRAEGIERDAGGHRGGRTRTTKPTRPKRQRGRREG